MELARLTTSGISEQTMRSPIKFLAGLIAVALQGMSADAQGLLTVREVSLGMALEIAQGALDACRQLDARIGVSVVDRGGHVLVTLRDDGAAHHTVELAQRKAYTARIFRQTTREFVERIINNPRAQGLKDTTGALASFGGVPIKVGEETIGGVGVSGAPGGANDEACAAAGIAKVSDRLK
jgi:uncharacterized protein GlcG (DUF336 family)